MRQDREQLMDLAEVAELFRIPIASLYSQRIRHVPPGNLGFRVGRYIRFVRADVEAWIDQQAHHQAPPVKDELPAGGPATETDHINPAEWLARLGQGFPA